MKGAINEENDFCGTVILAAAAIAWAGGDPWKTKSD